MKEGSRQRKNKGEEKEGKEEEKKERRERRRRRGRRKGKRGKKKLSAGRSRPVATGLVDFDLLFS